MMPAAAPFALFQNPLKWSCYQRKDTKSCSNDPKLDGLSHLVLCHCLFAAENKQGNYASHEKPAEQEYPKNINEVSLVTMASYT